MPREFGSGQKIFLTRLALLKTSRELWKFCPYCLLFSSLGEFGLSNRKGSTQLRRLLNSTFLPFSLTMCFSLGVTTNRAFIHGIF